MTGTLQLISRISFPNQWVTPPQSVDGGRWRHYLYWRIIPNGKIAARIEPARLGRRETPRFDRQRAIVIDWNRANFSSRTSWSVVVIIQLSSFLVMRFVLLSRGVCLSHDEKGIHCSFGNFSLWNYPFKKHRFEKWSCCLRQKPIEALKLKVTSLIMSNKEHLTSITRRISQQVIQWLVVSL